MSNGNSDIQATTDDEVQGENEQLPKEYSAGRDAKSGRIYYENHETRTATWKSPLTGKAHGSDLPWPYLQKQDQHGRKYYKNLEDGTSAYKHPVTGEHTLELRKSKSGRGYYVDHFARTTYYVNPADRDETAPAPAPDNNTKFSQAEGHDLEGERAQ